MHGFKSVGSAQRFLSFHAATYNTSTSSAISPPLARTSFRASAMLGMRTRESRTIDSDNRHVGLHPYSKTIFVFGGCSTRKMQNPLAIPVFIVFSTQKSAARFREDPNFNKD